MHEDNAAHVHTTIVESGMMENYGQSNLSQLRRVIPDWDLSSRTDIIKILLLVGPYRQILLNKINKYYRHI